MKKIKKIFWMLSLILGPSVFAQCPGTGLLLNGSHYNGMTGWNFTDMGDGAQTPATGCGSAANGGITVGGGNCQFITARCGQPMYVSRALPNGSLGNSWTVEFQFTLNAPAPGNLATNAPAITLAGFTAGTGPIRQGCVLPSPPNPPNTPVPICTGCNAFGGYQPTNMDAIWVNLGSGNPNLNCNTPAISQNTWVINAYARNGNSAPLSTITNPQIALIPVQPTYYVRLQRTDANWVMLSVFSDPGYTVHLPNSPQCLFIDGVNNPITGLNSVHHGVIAEGNCGRVANLTISGMRLDNGVPCPVSLTPSFTTVSTACNNLTFNGSASTGTPLQESFHYWEITPCDAAGNVPTGAPMWGQWYSGTAGVYTFPSIANGGPNFITCGNYYLVKLGISNCGNPWSGTMQVVYVTCPTLNAGPDVVNCNPIFQSEPFGNSANPGSPWSYVWTSSNPNVIAGNSGGPTGGASGEGSSTITMVATFQPGCSATDQLEYVGIVADAGPDRMVCTKLTGGIINPVEIGGNSTDGLSYLWTGPTGATINCPTCPKTLARLGSPNATGTFTLTVTGPNGLSCTDQVNITTNPNFMGYTSASIAPSPLSVDCNNLGSFPNYNYSLVATFGGPPLPYSYLWNSTTSPAVNNLNTVTNSTVSFTNCNSGSNPAYFFVTVTDANGCQASKVVTVNYVNGPPDPGDNPPGIMSKVPLNEIIPDYMDRASNVNENKLKFKVELAPNPNTGIFNLFIQSPMSSSPSVHLVDLSGRILYSQMITLIEGHNQIEVAKPELPSGVYFVKVDGIDEPIKVVITK